MAFGVVKNDMPCGALDHAFDWSARSAMIFWPKRGVSAQISASAPLNHLIVYTPKGQSRFCVEPASHAPNAINFEGPNPMSSPVRLAPGESLNAAIEIKLLDAG